MGNGAHRLRKRAPLDALADVRAERAPARLGPRRRAQLRGAAVGRQQHVGRVGRRALAAAGQDADVAAQQRVQRKGAACAPRTCLDLYLDSKQT